MLKIFLYAEILKWSITLVNFEGLKRPLLRSCSFQPNIYVKRCCWNEIIRRKFFHPWNKKYTGWISATKNPVYIFTCYRTDVVINWKYVFEERYRIMHDLFRMLSYIIESLFSLSLWCIIRLLEIFIVYILSSSWFFSSNA